MHHSEQHKETCSCLLRPPRAGLVPAAGSPSTPSATHLAAARYHTGCERETMFTCLSLQCITLLYSS